MIHTGSVCTDLATLVTVLNSAFKETNSVQQQNQPNSDQLETETEKEEKSNG